MFCRSRLKVLFVGSKFQFLRVWLKNLGKHRLDPQNAHPCAKWRVLTCHWFVRVLCIFHRLNMGNGGTQLSHQTSQDTPTSKRQPFGPSIHHGITGSILQCKPMGCRLITGRYVLGISYGKIGKNAKIGELWRMPLSVGLIMADDEGNIQEVVSRMKEKAGNLAYTFHESRQRFKILATAQHRHCILTTKSSSHATYPWSVLAIGGNSRRIESPLHSTALNAT